MSQKEEVKLFWRDYGSKLFLGLCFLLVGVLCFEAGLLQKSLVEPKPVMIRVAEPAVIPSVVPENDLKKSTPAGTSTKLVPGDNETCQFVGSKNSNKYHHPDSRCAKQIKPENKRCFASLDETKAKGYVAGCLTP